MRDSRPVLLVEDDTVDAMTVRRAFRDLKVTNPLVHALNGEEALARLQEGTGEKPCLILLDLNMPKMNGIEFLGIIKADAGLKKIPVVVLTTSSEERDVVESFRLSVAGYIIKPVDYRNFVEAVRTINLYWTLSEIPDESAEDSNAQCQTLAAGGRQS
jgi:CheY-like chemotaxis protein